MKAKACRPAASPVALLLFFLFFYHFLCLFRLKTPQLYLQVWVGKTNNCGGRIQDRHSAANDKHWHVFVHSRGYSRGYFAKALMCEKLTKQMCHNLIYYWGHMQTICHIKKNSFINYTSVLPLFVAQSWKPMNKMVCCDFCSLLQQWFLGTRSLK